jgi:PAS domain S-box-containing protein
MVKKPTYEELEQRVRILEKENIDLKESARLMQEGEQKDEAPRESERIYREIFKNSADFIFTTDLKGNFTDVNKAAEDLTGYTKNELIGMNYKDYTLEDSHERLLKAFERLYNEGRPIRDFSLEVIIKDGTKRYFEMCVSPLRKGEEIIGFQGSTRDITRRKQAEKELRESERYLKALISASPVGLGLVVNRKLDWANETLYRMLGYEQGSLLGESTRILYADDEAFERTGKELYNGIEETGIGQAETSLVRKDGTVFDCIIRVCSLERSDPAKGQIVSVTDISQIKIAYKQLIESEEKFRTIFESAPDGYYQADTNGRFIDGNKTAEEITGYRKDELIGKSFLDLNMLSSEDVARAVNLLNENMQGRGTGPDEFVLHRKDGHQVTVEIKTLPIKIRGKDVILGVARDISSKKNLENQLQQAQKMEAIGTLAGGIAHDFNNILGAIIGYTEIADLQAPEDTKVKASLKEVLKAGRRARDLVKQILAFSRKGDHERIPMQIAPIIKEALKLLKSTLPSTIEIRHDIKGETGVVQAEPTQIHQILMNLCANAAHAMGEEGGVLEIAIDNVELGSSDSESGYFDIPPGNYLRLTVSDTGEGMPREVLERIFEPYYTTREKGEGTGLGLSVVHGIVKSYGGTITAYSEPGKGSTFHVYFPLFQEKGEAPETEEITPIPTGNEHILFIDDEPVLVDLGKQMLNGLGYKVTTRTSSIEALELFKIKPGQFDLVITDMTMPHMTGEKLARELMKIRSDIPVIICTGYSEYISKEKANKMGIRAFIMKPLVMRDLANTVRKILDNT